MVVVFHRSVMGKTTAVLLIAWKDQEFLTLITLAKLHRRATKTVRNKGSDHSHISIS
jgi:hypothetical protein